MKSEISLGGGRRVRFFTDNDGGMSVIAGLNFIHNSKKTDEECISSILFDVPVNEGKERPVWQVMFLDPLTLRPSLNCACGEHGFITDGKWIPA